MRTHRVTVRVSPRKLKGLKVWLYREPHRFIYKTRFLRSEKMMEVTLGIPVGDRFTLPDFCHAQE